MAKILLDVFIKLLPTTLLMRPYTKPAVSMVPNSIAMLNRRWQLACRIRDADKVCKPPKGAVFKRYGTERLG